MLGNEVLAQLLADLLSRRSLIALMYQSSHSADTRARACRHRRCTRAARRPRRHAADEAHLGNVERNLRLHPRCPTSPRRSAPDPSSLTRSAIVNQTPPIPAPRTTYPPTWRLRPRPAARPLARRCPHRACSSCSITKKAARTTVLHGDPATETFLSEMVDRAGLREPAHDDGGRCTNTARASACGGCCASSSSRGLPLTMFGVGMALQRYPELAQRLRPGRLRDRQPRPALDPLPEPAHEDRGAPHALGTQVLREMTGGAAAGGLVHRPRQPQHPPPGGGPGRLRIRQRLLRRRPAFLAEGGQERRRPWRRSGGALLARHQRHALRAGQWLRTPKPSSPTCATPSMRCMPKVIRRPTGQDDEHRHALPAARQARPHRRAAALSRPCGSHEQVGSPAASTSRATGNSPSVRPRRPLVWEHCS